MMEKLDISIGVYGFRFGDSCSMSISFGREESYVAHKRRSE